MAHKRMGFAVVRRQFPQVTRDVVRIAVLGFELDGHVVNAEILCDSVLDQRQQPKTYV